MHGHATRAATRSTPTFEPFAGVLGRGRVFCDDGVTEDLVVDLPLPVCVQRHRSRQSQSPPRLQRAVLVQQLSQPLLHRGD